MRWNSFARSLVFAALAAAGVVPWLVLARPLLGGGRALGFYLVGATAFYLGGLGPERRHRVAIIVVTALAGCALALFTRTPTELVLGLGALLATGRSAFLYRTPRAPAARAVVVEFLLIGTGLVFARFLAGPSPLAVMLALWGFFLVQSGYFLVAGIRARAGSGRHPDAFEETRLRALALLDRGA